MRQLAATALGVAVVAALAGSRPTAAGPAAAAEVSAVAADQPIDLPNTPAEVVIPASWTVTALPEIAAKPVAAYQSPGGAHVVITRAGAYNPLAWVERTRVKYADQVELGVRQATDGYQRKKRSIQKVNGVPTMDLELSRLVDGARETVVLRFVFFRTYTLSLAAVAPAKERGAVDAIVRSFGPPKGYIP